ncbi:hypothetical protein [Lacticaseibacillus porcinae]|uniref:hypothetical protein n=1 Tax=Lacticaseibacillus porcinae TaxID=1123687 RepID=UPI000F77AE2C|nr:hypothetical protein [Lacticaseibacillus porcinae]
MQGEINGPIIGTDTITTLRGSKSAVVRVMKIHIDAEDIDWDQAPEPNPDVAMIAFSEIFYLPLELGTRVTISGPVEVRQALPPEAQAQLQIQVKNANTRLKTALAQWLKRNKLGENAARINAMLSQVLNETITVKDFYEQIKTLVYGATTGKTPALDKLQHTLHLLLVARYNLGGSAPHVLWFTQAEDVEMRDTLDDAEADDGPLQVIRLDGASLEAKWRLWEEKMKSAK